MSHIIRETAGEKRKFLPTRIGFGMLEPMKALIGILVLLVMAVSTPGCYTPEGGSSIPWNEPQPGENSSSFVPQVNF